MGTVDLEVIAMGKIRDRVLLGVVSGLAGGIVKNTLGLLLVKRKLAEYGGPSRAAGMLVPAHKITTPKGKLVGLLADTTISGLLGVLSVYTLSLSGKDKAALKGAMISGATAWTVLYGVLGTMGATRIQSPQPKTVLCEFLEHTLYGAVAASTAAYLGDEDLFDGKIPWSVGSVKIQPQNVYSNVVLSQDSNY